jgi:hypothetical protein
MRLRLAIVSAAAVVAVLAVQGVAFAKGPDEVTIEGDSLPAPVVLSGHEGGAGPFGALVEQAGFFQGTFGQEPDPMLDAAPTDDLGPELTLTWRVPGPSGATDTVHQLVYLDAEGGPLTYMPAGQPFFDEDETRGGWYRAPAGLLDTVATITGLDPEAPAAPADPPPPPPAPTPGWPVWVIGAAAVAVSALAGAGVALSRRRLRVTST